VSVSIFVLEEASARRESKFPGDLVVGNLDSSSCEAEERSMTPRWTNNEGRTLSVKTGIWDVFGIGNGSGVVDPKRTVIAWIRNSAFLKQ